MGRRACKDFLLEFIHCRAQQQDTEQTVDNGRNTGEQLNGGADDFREVYVSTPLEVCEQRDVKGLYARARRGEIKDFTGVSAPFEVPEHPALTLDTSVLTLEESVNKVLELILNNK